MDLRQPARRVGFECGNLAREDGAARGVLVAQVNIDVVDADCPCGDQHPFEEPMRVALEVIPILERTGLTLVDVDRHQSRRRFGAHDLPFAAGRKSRTAQTPQRRTFQLGDDRVDAALAAHAGSERPVAACFAIGRIVEVGRGRRIDRFCAEGRLDFGDGRAIDGIASNHRGGRVFAAPDAWRTDHADVATGYAQQFRAQHVGAGHLAR